MSVAVVSPGLPAVGTVTLAEGGTPRGSATWPAAWNASTAYNAGDKVSYQGGEYLASWYSQNQKPGADPNGAWQEIAMTESGTPVWTASRVFNSGDLAVFNGKTFGDRRGRLSCRRFRDGWRLEASRSR